MHLEFAAAAERQAADRGDDRHERILDALAGRLEVRDHGFEALDIAGLQQAERAGEIGTGGEGFLRLPDHQAPEVALGDRDRFLQPVEHVIVDRLQLGLEADHRDVVAFVDPHAHAVVLVHRAALRELLAEQRIGETLALVHRVGRARHQRIACGAVTARGAMHAVAAIEHPVGQGRVRHRLAGDDVVGDPVATCFQPAACQVSNGPSDQP